MVWKQSGVETGPEGGLVEEGVGLVVGMAEVVTEDGAEDGRGD
jgi:hypothetical protein